jgi:hypothetical protein
MSGLIIGIDPGIIGGWAVLNHSGELVAVGDLPVAGDGAQRMVAGAVFAALVTKHSPSTAILERVSAMPGQGVSGMFRFGQAVGVVAGVLGALSIPTLYVAPAIWKRHYGLPAEKEAARQRAIERWPAHAVHFARKKDHGRAEAAFIGLWDVRAASLSGESPMSARTHLPSRRRAVAEEIIHRDARYRVHVGFFQDDKPAELFINAQRQNSTLDAFAGDSAILVSLLLQHGITPREIGHSLKRSPDGTPASVIGAAIDVLMQMEAADA